MEKIDRLGWAVGFAVESFGVRVGVRLNRPDFLEQVMACLPPLRVSLRRREVDLLYSVRLHPSVEGKRLRPLNLLYQGSRLLGRMREVERVFPVLSAALITDIAERAEGQVLVHAGVVGWKGQAILVPGRSCSGKTTLVAELVRAGATYYSDEFAVLDRSGRVHPYPKPLALRDHPGLPQRDCPVESLGGRQGVAPLPVGLVAFTRFRGAATVWRPRRLTLGRAMLAALDNTPAARRQPRMVLKYLSRALRNSLVLKGSRGNARQTAAALLRTLAQDRN